MATRDLGHGEVKGRHRWLRSNREVEWRCTLLGRVRSKGPEVPGATLPVDEPWVHAAPFSYFDFYAATFKRPVVRVILDKLTGEEVARVG